VSGVRPVRCPARPVSGLSGSLVRTRLSGRPVSSPSGVQPSGGCPSGRSRLVPGPPGDGDGETSARRAAVTTGSSRVPCGPAPSPAARVDGPRRMDAGSAAKSCAGRRGSVGRGPGPGGASAGGCTDRPGRPDRRRGVGPFAGDRARQGSGWREVAARHRAARPSGLEPRLLCVVIAEPDVRMDGPGRTTRARRPGWGRGPSAAQLGSERDRLDAGNALTCKNGGGRDRV
jgi:hypothetical protein